MALQLVCGTSGSGKTTWCYKQMSDSIRIGRKIIFIVPEQVSLSVENQAIETLGYLGNGREVLSFARLFHRVYSYCGGPKRNYLDKIGKIMLINRILTEESKDLTIYGHGSKSAELAGEILTTISEFKRHLVSPQTIKSEIDNLPDQSTLLKLTDIAHIYENYNQKLNKSGCDSEDNLTILKELIPNCDLIKESDIFIDCFSGFTPQEFEVISALIETAPNVYVTLTTDNSNQPLFHPVEETKHKLLSISNSNLPQINLQTYHGHKNHELIFLEQNYGRYPKKVYNSPCENIVNFVCDTPYNEVDMCARDILDKVRTKSYKFGEIGIITGDIKGYSSIIEESFKKHGIGYFIDKKHGILNHPVTLYLLSLCDIFVNNFSYDSVFSFLKTRLSGIDSDQIDLMENYVIETGIKGKMWHERWHYKLSPENMESINNTREQFLSIVMPFRDVTKGRSSAETFVYAMKKFMADTSLAEKIEEITKQLGDEPGLALEYRQIYNLLISTLDQLSSAMGDLTFGIEKFREMFTAGLAGCEIGVIPPSCDKVLCGSFDRSKHQQLKVLYILGANDGSFPPLLSGTGIIPDAQRRVLEKNNIKIAPDNKTKALEQPFNIYEIITVPTHSLIISYPMSNIKGEGVRTSMVISALKEMFPQMKVMDNIKQDEISLVSSPDATLSHLIENNSDLWNQVMCWYTNNPSWKKKVNFVLSAKAYKLSDNLSREMSLALWGNQLNSTISRLETFAKCPFSYFAEFGLNLKERKEFSFSSPDAGNFIHKIMEDFSNYVVQNEFNWSNLDKKWCIDKVNELSDKLLDETTSKMPFVTKRHKFLISRLRKASSDAIIAVVEHIKSGVFKPYATEFSFDNQNGIPPIEIDTPKGKKMVLYGKIDRIDTGEGLFRIIDYKSGDYDLDLSKVYQGVSLQLFVYSNALKNKLGDVSGMFYLTIDSPLIKYNHSITAEQMEQKFLSEFRMAGYVVGSEDVIEKMDTGMTRWSTVVSAQNTKDGIKSTRLLTKDEFNALSNELFKKIGKYGDDILDGKHEVSPVSIGQTTACTYCKYKPVCGFEEKTNKFRTIKSMNKQEIFDEIERQNL